MIALAEMKRMGKYGIVGISSLIVGLVVFNVLYFVTHRLVFSNAMSYLISVVNGFIFNRKWTFREKRGESVWAQSSKFFVVNLVGYTLNITVVVFLLALYTRTVTPDAALSILSIAHSVVYKSKEHVFSFVVVNSAGMIATAVVTVWNFLINRAWTFRH